MKEGDISRGQNILWPFQHTFRGVRTPATRQDLCPWGQCWRPKLSMLCSFIWSTSQNAETWNTSYFRNYATERHENLTQSWERKMQFSNAIWWRHNKSKMADGRHTENRFVAISWRHIGRSTRNLDRKWTIICRYRSHDQNCNFRKFKMADGHHFENSFISISQLQIIRFDQIWYAHSDFHFEDGLFDKNLKFCKFKMADGRHTENSFWLYLSAILTD